MYWTYGTMIRVKRAYDSAHRSYLDHGVDYIYYIHLGNQFIIKISFFKSHLHMLRLYDDTFFRFYRIDENGYRLKKSRWIYVSKFNWTAKIFNRWRDWTRRRVLARKVLARFVNDYVLPHLYSPHHEGPMFLRLKRAINQGL